MQKRELNHLHRNIRRILRTNGIAVVTIFPKYKCRKMAKESINIHWVLNEEFGYVILNIDTLTLFNTIRERLKLSRIRTRDLEKAAIYRYPKKAFIYVKLNK